MSEMLAAALKYAKRGWACFPLKPGEKVPIGLLAPNGVLNATTSEVVIRAWWQDTPSANVGVATGEKSGLLVLDVDPDAGGEATLQRLIAQHGNWPEIETQSETGGGGQHIWFAYPASGRYGNTVGKLGPGLDTRGEGGYVVAPPSVTEGRYDWIFGGGRESLSVAPAWLLDLLADKPAERPALQSAPAIGDAYAKKALEDELTAVALSQPGSRNHTLNTAAFNLGQLVGAGLLEHEQTAWALLNAARHVGLPESEASATIRSGLTAGMREPRQIQNRRSERSFGSSSAAPNRPEIARETASPPEDDPFAGLGIVEGASAPTNADDLVSLAAALGGYLDAAEAVKRGEVRVVATGLAGLDRLTGGGFRGGELVVLAARPGVGKSAMATTIARHAAGRGVGVLLVSAEMGAEQVAGRLLAGEARVDAQRLRTGEVDAEEWARVEAAFQTLSALPVWLVDRSSPFLAAVVSAAERAVAQKGVGLVVVDYVGLVEVPGRDERRVKVGAISRALKALAREQDVPVLALSQLNREVEKRADHRPQMSDLREAGDLEQDADLVVFLSREEVHDPDTDRRGIADLIVAKNRSGPTGAVPLKWLAEQVRFADLEVYQPDWGYSDDGGSF